MIINGIELLNQISENKVKDLDNENCSNCNECCTATTIITKDEYMFYEKYFRTKGKTLFKDCIKRHKEIEKKKNAMNLMCPFSSKNKRCLIYNIRPEVCRKFHCKETLNVLNIDEYLPEETYIINDLIKK